MKIKQNVKRRQNARVAQGRAGVNLSKSMKSNGNKCS